MQSFFSARKSELTIKLDNAVACDSKRGTIIKMRPDNVIRTLLAVSLRNSLRHIAVGNCGGMFPILLEVLKESPSLEIFESAHPSEKEKEDPSLSLAFCSLIASCSRLSVLRLSDGYGEKVIIPVLEKLRESTSIRRFDIARNSLNSDIITHVATLLSKNGSLVSLMLKGNNYTAEGIQLLASAVQSNTAICELDILDEAAKDISEHPMLRDTISSFQNVFSRNATTTQKMFLQRLPQHLVQFFVNADDSARCWRSYLPHDVRASAVSFEAAPSLEELTQEQHSDRTTHGFLLRRHKH